MRLAAVVAAGVMLGVSGSVVQAATITRTVNFGPATLTSPTSTTLDVSQFDASLGTLTGITVGLAGTSNGTLQVRRGNNGAQGSVTYNATVGVDYALSLNSNSLFVIDVGGGVSVTVPRNGNVTGTAATGNGSDSVVYSDPVSIALFTGLGVVTFDLGLAPENSVDSESPANVNTLPPFREGTETFTFTNLASAQLTVIYQYSRNGGGGGGGGGEIGIPAPAALSLFSLSLLGLGLVGRARSRA